MLQQLPTSPLWLELLKAGIGPVLAAIFVVVGLFLRDRIERRNAAQEWFDQTYITDGKNRYLTHGDCMAKRIR